MPTISFFYGILIHMYWQEHHPPHFHALYGDFEAIIDIRTLEILRGDLPRRALDLIREWGRLYHQELMEDWDLCQGRQHPHKIPPLE